MEQIKSMSTSNTASTLWTITPEMQAALDAANVRLAEMAEQHAPAAQPQTPPELARELVAWGKLKLKPEGAKLLASTMTSREFFETLLAHDCLADARRILSHAMPKRRALWWSVMVAHDALRTTPSPEFDAVERLVTQFVLTPTEDVRRACGELAKRIPVNGIAGCLVNAAFFSAGSVSPPGLPPVAPRPFVTGRLTGVAVYLAAVTRSAALYKQYLREYLRWGVAISAGQMLWTDASTASTESLPSNRLDAYWPQAASRTKEVCV